jgi:hypothetical protein
MTATVPEATRAVTVAAMTARFMRSKVRRGPDRNLPLDGERYVP